MGQSEFHSLAASVLSLSAVIAPAVFRLGPFHILRMPARLISCLGVNQHAGHVLGVDGEYETTMGARLEHIPMILSVRRNRPEVEKWAAVHLLVPTVLILYA